MQMRHYFWLIWSRLWLIVLGVVLCAGATYVVSKHQTLVYEASALIQVNGTGANDSASVFSNQSLAVSYSLEVTNSDILQAAALQLPGMSANQIGTAISASPLNNTQIVEIRADATSPQLAANIANTVASVFIQIEQKHSITQLQGVEAQLAQQLATAQAQVNTAQAQLTTLQNVLAPATQISQQRDTLSAYQLNYDSLLTNYNQVRLQEALAANVLSITQSAVPPIQPQNARATLDTAIAAALALLLMVTLVLILDWVNKKIKTPDDVVHLSGLEPLGSIPLVARLPQSVPALNETLEQAAVTLSTNFDSLRRDRRAILVSSIHEGAGSSTVATALAYALAQSGQRVLLIDANFHHPTLHELFNRPNVMGLANVLADISMLQQTEAISAWLHQWETSQPRLWVLPSGTPSVSPATLLHSPDLRSLLNGMLQQTRSASGQVLASAIDLVIFDMPALAQGADVIALAPVADGSILVVEAEREEGQTLQEAHTALRRLGAPVIGVVINRQQAKHRPYLYVNDEQLRVLVASMGAETPTKYPLVKPAATVFSVIAETPMFSSAQELRATEEREEFDLATQPTSTTPRIPQEVGKNGRNSQVHGAQHHYHHHDQDGTHSNV